MQVFMLFKTATLILAQVKHHMHPRNYKSLLKARNKALLQLQLLNQLSSSLSQLNTFASENELNEVHQQFMLSIILYVTHKVHAHHSHDSFLNRTA